MADMRIHSNPMILNKTLKTQREMYQRQIEGIRSEYAKQDAKDLGLTPEQAKGMMDLLRSDVLQSFQNTIATLDHQKVNNIITSEALRIFEGGGFQRPSKYPENPDLLMFYDELHSKALSFLTNKKTTGQDLMWKTTQIADELRYSFNDKANSFSNYADVQEAYRHFKSGQYGLTVFDLETFGGKNEFGKQQVDKITEFTFDYYDNVNPDATRQRVTGFVGLSQEEAARYANEFSNFRDFGSLTEKQKVIAKSLSKIGHEDTLIEEDTSKRGRFVVKRYAKEDDAAVTKERILAGIQKSREIGETQQKYRYNGMMAWEEDLANAIIKMQGDNSTIAGHNINRADIPWINQFLSQNASPEMKGYMSSKGFSGQLKLPANRVLDTLSVLQMADVNPKAMSELWPDDERRRVLKGDGHTPFQQEALGKRFFREMFESSQVGAHASDFDVDVLHKLITKAQIGNKNFFDRMMELAGEAQSATRTGASLKQNQQQLFYAAKSLGGDFGKESLFGFKSDSLTGSLKTMDGVELAENLKPTKTFPEYLTKKGVSYTIDSIEEISANQEYVDKMKRINPSLAVNDLMAVKVSPVIDEGSLPYADLVQKNRESSYIIGPRQDIKSFFSNNMVLYGEKDESGEYKLVDGADKILGKNKFVERGGKITLESVDPGNLINETIKDGTFINMNDAAARNIRDNKMSRYAALSRFSETISQMADEDKSDLPVAEKKRLAISKMLQSSQEVARATAEGRAHTLTNQESPVALLQDVLGYEDFRTGKQVVHPRTIDNAIASLDHFESIKDEINLLLGEVDKRTQGSSKAEKSYLFAQGLEAIQAKSLEKMQQTHADLVDGFVRGFEKDYFEVDVSSLSEKTKRTPLAKVMDDTNPEGTLKINLRPGGEHGLIRSLVGDTRRVNQEPEAVKQLQALVDVLQKDEGLLQDIYGNSKSEFLKNNTSTTFARKIIEGLTEVRAQDATAGYLSPNRVHNVQGISEFSGVLSQDEIMETLNDRFSGFRQGSVMQINNAQTPEGARARRLQAQSIVDDILMAPFDEKSLASYGYNDKQIEKLKMTRDVRRKDYVSYVESLLGGVSKTNMSLVADSKSGVFGLVDRGEFIDLSNVPREGFTDGIFYTQVGRNRVANELHIVPGNAPSEIRLVSGLGQAMRESNWDLERSIENAIRRGEDPEERVVQWVSNIARTVREGSSIMMFDEQDMKSQFEVNEKNIINALPSMSGLNALDLERKEEFLTAISRKGFAFDNMSDTDKQLWALNRTTIVRDVASKSGDKYIAAIAKNINSRAKSSAIDAGRFRFDPVQSELEYYNRSSRGIEDQIRYLAFREDYARDRLREQGLDDRVDLGAPLRTQMGHALSTRTYQGTSQRAYTEFVTDRIALTSNEYKEKLIQAKRAATNAEEIKAIDSLLIKGNLTEGGAIGDARLADALFQNYDRQKISFKRELFTEHESNMERFKAIDELRQVIPEFKISEDGKIEFTYKKGRYVNRFDKLFDEVGYGGAVSPVGAKYDGALRFGFFTKGGNLIADEADVIKHVSDLAKEKGLNIQNQDQFLSAAEQLYDANFYVERLSAEPYRKVMEDRAEKHMTAFAYYGLGESGDKRILRALSGMGLQGQRGNVLDRRFFDELLDENNISNSILSDISTKGITTDSYIKAVTDAGFKDIDEFKSELTRERFLPSTTMDKYLGASMALVNEDYKHQSRQVPITTAINDILDDETKKIMESGVSREDALRQASANVYGQVKDVFIKDGEAGLKLDGDGKLVLPDMSFYGDDYIDSTKMAQVYNERFKDVEGKTFEGLLDTGRVSRHSYAVQQDYTGRSGSGVLSRPEIIVQEDGTLRTSPLSEEDEIRRSLSKGAKITDREIEMLETTRYDQALIDRMSKTLSPEDFRNAFGHAVNEADGGYVLKDSYEGRTVLGDFTSEMRRIQFAKPGEALVTQSQAPDYLKPVVKAIGDVSGGDVGLRTAEEIYSTKMNTLAMRFNANPGDMSDLTRNGFQVVKLSELDRMTGQDGSYLLNDSLNSIYNKNLIIDLQDDIVTPDIINSTNHGSRYLALGKLPTGKVGENLIQQGPHQLIGSMLSARNKLEDTRMMTDSDVAIQRNNLIEAIDGFNNQINTTVFGKSGLLRNVSEIRLEKSTMGKASLMDIQDILNMDGFPNVLENVKVDGKSIIDHHRSGTLMDFKILSEDQFREMGVFDDKYLQELGMDEGQLKAQLRSGVMGFSHRSPTIYEGSIRPTMLILNENMHGNQAIEYAAGALSSHMDADGDAPRTWLASYSGQDGQTLDSIQYKAAQRNGKVDDQITEAFNNQKAMMYRNAVVMNPYFSDKLAADVEEMSAIDQRLASKLTALNSTSPSGKMYPGLDRKATPAESAALMDRYNTVQNVAIEQKIADTPSLRALDDDAARKEATKLFENKLSDHVDYLSRAVKTFDPSEQEEYSKAADYYIANLQDTATDMAKMKQSAAGEINLPIYQINKVRNLSHDVLDSDQHRFLTHVLESSEEAFLSPKHSEAKMVSNALTMQEFNRALKSVTGNPLRGDREGSALMEGWFKKNLPGRFSFDRFSDMYDSEDAAYKDAARMIQKVFSDRDNINRYNTFMSAVGSRKNGIPMDRLEDALIFPEESRSLMSQSYRVLEQLDDSGYRGESTQRRSIYADAASKADVPDRRLLSEWTPPTDPDMKTASKNILESAKTAISKVNLTGKDLAFGALGIAGAVMVAGFVGGNPSRPATTHAAAQQQQEAPMAIPSLSDGEAMQVAQNPQGGYIININANTDKGRDYVQDAIQQSMAQSYTSTNINVSMNIKDNTGNITDRNIENIIRGSFS